MRTYTVTIPLTGENARRVNGNFLPIVDVFDTDDAMLEYTEALDGAGITYACTERPTTTSEEVPARLEQLGIKPRVFTAAVTRVTEYRVEAYSAAHAERRANNGDWEGEVDSTTTDITITEDQTEE